MKASLEVVLHACIKTLLHRLTAIEVWFFIIRVPSVCIIGVRNISTIDFALLPEHAANSIES